MQSTRIAAGILAVGVMIAAGISASQTFPIKPIRIVTPGTGGGADLIARLTAQGLSGNVGQQVIVDNRPSGIIPGEIVFKAPPDGYVLLLSGNTLWIGWLLQSTPYDPVKDFAPVTLAVMTPQILFAHPSLPVKSVRELIALAKARPGALNYASGSPGSSNHVAGELFKALAGVDIVTIPYTSQALAASDLLAGNVQLAFGTAAGRIEFVKAGRLKALAVTSAKPSLLFPGLPTIASAGLAGYDAVGAYGIFAPAKTPDTVINRLNMEIVKVLNAADIKKRFFDAGFETVGSTPEYLANLVKTEITNVGTFLKNAGVRAE